MIKGETKGENKERVNKSSEKCNHLDVILIMPPWRANEMIQRTVIIINKELSMI